MKNLIQLLVLAMLLQGCKSQNETSSSNNGVCNYALCFTNLKPSSLSNNCEDVSATEMTYTQTLLNTAINSSSIQNGEFHPDAVFNMIEEVGRRGCSESLDGLLTIAENVEATKSVNAGMVSYEFLGTRKLQAVIESLAAVATPSDDDAIEFLSRIANESNHISDGYNGRFLQDLATRAISLINNEMSSISFKRFHYSWNTIPACSSNYLLTDGTRTNSVNWSTYVVQIQNLNSSSPILLNLADEPRYCDGHNGFHAQQTAINRLSLPTPEDAIDFTKSLLDSDPLRGSITGTMAVSKLLGVDEIFEVSTIEDMAEYLRIDTGHPDETVRSEIINFIIQSCGKLLYADSECSQVIEDHLETSAKEDPYYIVRLRAQQGIDHLELIKENEQ